jgi:SAM-dependent methyltransferase
MNVVDVVASPMELLREMARVLKPGGVLLLCTPFDWTATSARMEQWVGGHSKRSLGAGNPARVLEKLLTPGASPASIEGLRLRASREGIPWNVRVHDRHTSAYTLHAVVATREG